MPARSRRLQRPPYLHTLAAPAHSPTHPRIHASTLRGGRLARRIAAEGPPGTGRTRRGALTGRRCSGRRGSVMWCVVALRSRVKHLLPRLRRLSPPRPGPHPSPLNTGRQPDDGYMRSPTSTPAARASWMFEASAHESTSRFENARFTQRYAQAPQSWPAVEVAACKHLQDDLALRLAAFPRRRAIEGARSCHCLFNKKKSARGREARLIL